MNSQPVLTTERLILRSWEARDLEPFAALNGDPVAMEHLVKCLTREESDAYIERVREHEREHGFSLSAVEHRESGTFVGMVGLRYVPFEQHFTPALEIGWRILPAFWGRGYASEAARESLRFGFETLGAEEIVAFTIPVNLRSRKVMERIGMRYDPHGDFDHPLLPEGHPKRRHVLYRIGRSAFEKQ